jgi:chromosome partitioning protein
LTNLFHLLITEPAAMLAAVLLVALLRPVYLGFRALQQIARARAAVHRRSVNGQPVEGAGFWLKQPIAMPIGYDERMGRSIPVLMIGSLKGGVGKTTLSANIASYFAARWFGQGGQRLRVLLVDLDFQGSLSTMTVSPSVRYSQPSKANMLVSGELWNGTIAAVAEPLSQPGGYFGLSLSILPATYDLATAENRTLIEWLFPRSHRELLDGLLRLLRMPGAEPQSHADLRYKLAEAFLDPAVQRDFDLIVIDAPPRLTTAHIQALCASTHLLIPSIIDQLSGDAVARYADQIAVHQPIAPHLQIIGVVGTVVPNNLALGARIGDLAARIEEARLIPPILPEACFIRQRAIYRDTAGQQIAYLNESNSQSFRDLRQEVDTLGRYVAHSMGVHERGWRPNEPRVEGWLE